MSEITILGGGESWAECPFEGEVWAVASVLSKPEVSCYDKIHKVFAFDEYKFVKGSIRIAKKYHIPVISLRGYATEKYPLEEIKEEFGTCFFRNTVSYMLAYAIYKGYEKIWLFGIDQGPQWDYLANKFFVFYWLGVATGRGIKFELPKSTILVEPMHEQLRKYVEELRRKAGIARRYIEAQM